MKILRALKKIAASISNLNDDELKQQNPWNSYYNNNLRYMQNVKNAENYYRVMQGLQDVVNMGKNNNPWAFQRSPRINNVLTQLAQGPQTFSPSPAANIKAQPAYPSHATFPQSSQQEMAPVIAQIQAARAAAPKKPYVPKNFTFTPAKRKIDPNRLPVPEESMTPEQLIYRAQAQARQNRNGISSKGETIQVPTEFVDPQTGEKKTVNVDQTVGPAILGNRSGQINGWDYDRPVWDPNSGVYRASRVPTPVRQNDMDNNSYHTFTDNDGQEYYVRVQNGRSTYIPKNAPTQQPTKPCDIRRAQGEEQERQNAEAYLQREQEFRNGPGASYKPDTDPMATSNFAPEKGNTARIYRTGQDENGDFVEVRSNGVIKKVHTDPNGLQQHTADDEAMLEQHRKDQARFKMSDEEYAEKYPNHIRITETPEQVAANRAAAEPKPIIKTDANGKKYVSYSAADLKRMHEGTTKELSDIRNRTGRRALNPTDDPAFNRLVEDADRKGAIHSARVAAHNSKEGKKAEEALDKWRGGENYVSHSRALPSTLRDAPSNPITAEIARDKRNTKRQLGFE